MFNQSKMEDNFPTWASASFTSLKYLDSVQKRAIRLIEDTSMTTPLAALGYRRNIGVLSLLYRYFVDIDTCSREIKAILPLIKVFSRNTRQAASNHPYLLALHRTSKLCNLLPASVFLKSTYIYNLDKYKSNINKLVNNISAHPFLLPNFPLKYNDYTVCF